MYRAQIGGDPTVERQMARLVRVRLALSDAEGEKAAELEAERRALEEALAALSERIRDALA